MIKKMLAMLVAISCAFGAWADTPNHISWTDFSGLTAGETFYTQRDDSGADSGTSFWYNGATNDLEGTIANDGLANYLNFESNITNPLYRTINDCYGAKSVSALPKRSIGTGLFIDTHVQFTPYLVNDQHLAPSAITDDDKLIVWVRETEVENDANETNLIVTAGYYDAYNNLSASNYVVNISSADVSELCSHTNRLTIKSYSNITDSEGGPAGFVVYLNEHAIEYTADAFAAGCDYLDDLAATPESYYETGHHMLFPSLMGCNLTDYDKLSGVGYAGMGQIYDVIFDDKTTDFPPFAADATDFKVVPGEGVESFIYDNVQYFTEQSLTVPAAVASVTISNVVYSSGWQHKKGTWYNGSTIVSNEYDAVTDTDYGTFVLANGTTLNLAGFKPNFTVGGVQYQTLFGGTVTEPTGAFGAAKNGGTIVLNNDILIAEGEGQIVVEENDELTIDLNGHTIQGTASDDTTIVNEGGILTIVDNSVGQTGKVLGCLNYDEGLEEWANNYRALGITEAAVATTLDAGTYELIEKDELNNTLVISNGAYLCYSESGEQPESFYLVDSLAKGATYSWSQDTDTGFWYAIVTSGSAPTTYAVTFSTNTVVVAEYTTNITAGATLPVDAIPAFTGGAWDVDPTNAVINAATNFNYTIAVQLSYFPQKTIEQQWADRDGTAAKPFVIRNYDDFDGLKRDVADGYNADKYFEVVVDNITLTNWVGIGTETAMFEGTLNGNGKTINIAFAPGKYNGLFCFIRNATISNLTVNVTDITVSGSTGAAAFVGKAYGANVLTAVKATGSLGTSGNRISHNAGGLVVYLLGPSGVITYNNCTNAMDVYSSGTKLGGFLGWASGGASVVINNGVNLGNLSSTNIDNSGDNGVGGFIGWDYNDAISTTFNGAISLGTVEMGTGKAGSFYGERSGTLSGTTGVIQGLANQKPVGASGVQAHAFDWATVDGNVATFVTPVTTVGSTVTYKAMQPASDAFTLTADDASLTIITNLCAYTGTVTVDSTLTAQGYELVETADANGVTFTCAIPGPADPWEPASEDPADVAAKVDEVFGSESEVAAHVTTYAEYEALVTYIQSTTGAPATPDLLTEGQVDWMWKSYILGANPLFDEEPAVQITSLTAGATAGLWDFTVKVTEGDDTDAYNVAADKVGALVKISSSLTSGTWVAPTAGNISAVKLLGGNLIQVEVNFGDGTSGFMKVSEE